MAVPAIRCEVFAIGDGNHSLIIQATGLSLEECRSMGRALEQPVRDAVAAATNARRTERSTIRNMITDEVTPLGKLS
jgi:hypothetical protein